MAITFPNTIEDTSFIGNSGSVHKKIMPNGQPTDAGLDSPQMFAICSFRRFILRTQAQQSKIEGQPPSSENPEDYAVVFDGPVVGRIYPNPIRRGMWNWHMQSPTGASGYADSLDEAKEALKQRWFAETKKLSQR